MAGDNPAGSDDSRIWDEPFVPAESVAMVVTRRLAGMLIEDLAGLGLANEDIAEWCDVPAREVIRLRQVAKVNSASEVPEGASGA